MLLSLLVLVCVCTATTFASNFRRHLLVSDRFPKSNVHAGITKLLNFTQKVDHSNHSDTRTFQQLAYIRKDLYKPGGPIFFVLGQEGPSSSDYLEQGAMADIYAPAVGAMILQLEHRYYGRSWPTPDMSVDNMKYLSSEQYLADAANFIVQMTKQLNLNPNTTKWITFGGGYAGALSAWMRLKYPNLVFAAVASSAPVQAVLDFSVYLEVVVDTLNANDAQKTECVAALKAGTTEVVRVKTYGSVSERKEMQVKFNLCKMVNDHRIQQDLWTFYSSISDAFGALVQNNNSTTVAEVCHDYMDNKNLGEPIDRLAVFVTNEAVDCIDFKYMDNIAALNGTSWKYSAVPGGRSWLWQTCQEFGYYQTTTTEKTIFATELPLEYYLDICTDCFPGLDFSQPTMQQRIDKTNAYYGGNATSPAVVWNRTVFVNGDADPWHVLSVLHNDTSNDAMRSIVVPGQSHCADMLPNREDDTPELRQARQSVLELLQSWLSKEHTN